MAATAHKTKGCSDESTAIAIVQGFTGQLKAGGIIYAEHDKLAIINSVKTETNKEDAVSTLQIFVGDPNIFKERSANKLANLYCPTMSNYRCIKVHFFQK